MQTLKGQLRDLRAANVEVAELYEDGSLKRAVFFRAPEPEAKAAPAPEKKYPFQVGQGEVDLLSDVIMAPEQQVTLSAEDFPAEVIEALAAVDAEGEAE